MAEGFDWIRPGYDLAELNFEWNIQVPFLQTTGEEGDKMDSPYFSPQESPDRKWYLYIIDQSTEISIVAWHSDSSGSTDIVDQFLVKISILNGKGREVFQQMLPSKPDKEYVEFILNKKDVIKSQCQQVDGSLTFCCKILLHVKKEPVSLVDPPDLAMDCSLGLSTQLEGLFDGMKFSDVRFVIGGRVFPAHKNILVARSEVFAAMFQHPTKENLTNQITIEDVDPEVFHELLRFIYTGRLNSTTMETMAVGLLFAADKYLLSELENECEKYLLRHMSPVNCVELLLHGDLLNPAENLKEAMKEAARFFRRLPGDVMATARWEKMEEENPRLLLKVQKILFSKRVSCF